MRSFVLIASLLLLRFPQQSSVFAPEFLRVDPNIKIFRTIHQSRVGNELTLSVVLADPSRDYDLSPESRTWNPGGLLGVFLQDQSGRIWNITIMQGSMESNVAVEHANAETVVLSRTTTDYGLLSPALKLFIDPVTKRLLRTIEYWPAAVESISSEGDSLYAQFAPRDPLMRRTIKVQEQAGKIRIVQGSVAPPAPQVLPPGWSIIESEGFKGEFAGIAEGAAPNSRSYLLPQTDRQTLARLRPRAVRDEFGPREVSDIQDHIGPYQVAGNLLWFGKTFYDGEGTTGVGGFGYFDLRSRRYAMFVPASSIDWSASAILVEPDAIWIGLVNRPEGADNPGGLMRYDRNTTQTQVYPVKSVITQIVRHNGALYLGTVHGLYVMRGSTFTKYLIEPALDGSLALVEPAPL